MGEEPQTQGVVQAAVETRWDPEDEYHPQETKTEPPAWMDGGYRIGIHTSIAGHITDALDTAHRLGANAVQIFSASPRMWQVGHPAGASFVGEARSRFTAAEAAAFRARREELKLGPLAIHANYLINLASPDRVLRVRSIQAFHDEIVRAVALGADFLVLHPGAAKGGSTRGALELVSQGLRQAARGIRIRSLRILLENTAGQGTSLGATFSELKVILDTCPEFPLGVCIDTAHLLAAGFDITTPASLDKTLQAVEATVGLAQVYVIHMNDSKVPLGARLDRHEHIGKGHIGLEAFRQILAHPLLAPPSPEGGQTGIATRGFILETPIDKPGDDARNVAALWKLVGKKIKVKLPAKDGFRVRKKVHASRNAKARPRTKKRKKMTRRRRVR